MLNSTQGNGESDITSNGDTTMQAVVELNEPDESNFFGPILSLHSTHEEAEIAEIEQWNELKTQIMPANDIMKIGDLYPKSSACHHD